MQESVTYKILKKTKKQKIGYVIFLVLFFFIIFLLTGVLVVSKRLNLCFETKSFFIVYAQKNKNRDVLLENQKQIKNIGGAGVIVEKNNEYYLSVAIYLKKDDANEIKKNIENQFNESGILEYVSKPVSGKNRNFIKQNDNYLHLYKKLYNFIADYEKLMFDYAKSEISEGKFMSKLLSHKLEIEKLEQICSFENDTNLNLINNYAGKFLTQFENLINKFYITETKESLCFEFFINYCLIYIDQNNNLN